MRFSFAAGVAVAAAAQTVAASRCWDSCVGQAIQTTDCSSADSHCFCASPSFLETVKECSASACAEEEQAAALHFAEDFCATVDKTKHDLKRDANEPRRGSSKWWRERQRKHQQRPRPGHDRPGDKPPPQPGHDKPWSGHDKPEPGHDKPWPGPGHEKPPPHRPEPHPPHKPTKWPYPTQTVW